MAVAATVAVSTCIGAFMVRKGCTGIISKVQEALNTRDTKDRERREVLGDILQELSDKIEETEARVADLEEKNAREAQIERLLKVE